MNLHVVLVAPEIAPNTGNIIRLCANTGATLHLVDPLGFSLDDRLLRRAGLDYHELATLVRHVSWPACVASLGDHARRFAFSSHATHRYDTVGFRDGDALVFGAESAGLAPDTIASFPAANVLGIPMLAGNRSLNLANAVAVVVYEAWRQQRFTGASAFAATGETLGSPSVDR